MKKNALWHRVQNQNVADSRECSFSGSSGSQALGGIRQAGPTRRTLLAGACAALNAAQAPAQATAAPIVIGVLTDVTGIGASVSGPPLVQAVRMAVQDTAPLPDGRSVAVVTESYQLKPADALAIAQRWFDQGVSVIVDVPGAAASLAVQELAKSRGRSTLVTGSVSSALTGQACSPFGSAWAVDSAAMTTALVGAVARTGARTWFLVVPDTALGLAVQADAIRAIEATGGRLTGRSLHPPDATDYASVVTQARDSAAQAIGLCDITQALTDQLGQFQTGGLFDSGRTVASFLPSIAALHAAGAKAARGLLLASPYYWDQNDQARSFAYRFMSATGQMPDAPHAAAYVATRHYLRAAVAMERPDAARINQEMRRVPVYFFGRIARLRLDGRLAADLSLLRVKAPEAMKTAWDYYDQIGLIPAQDIYRQVSQTGCPLGL